MRDRFYLRGIIIFITSFFTAGILSCCSYSQKNEISVLTIVPAETNFFTRTTTPKPTETAVPDQITASTSTPTATPTPLFIWNYNLPDHENDGEPYPDLEVITAENVHRLEEVDVLGQGWVDGIALSPDGKVVAVYTATGLYFFDTHSLKQINQISFCETVKIEDCKETLDSFDNIDYFPEGEYMVIARKNVYKLNLATMEISELISEPERYDDDSKIVEIQFNADGTRLVILRFFEYYKNVVPPCINLEVYDTSEMELLFEHEFTIAQNYDGIGLIKNNIVQYQGHEIDLETGEILHEFPMPFPEPEQPVEINYLENETFVISSYDSLNDCEILIDTATASYPDLFDISKDGKKAITFAEDGSAELLVFDFGACKVNRIFYSFPQPYWKIDFSPNGTYIISGSLGGWYKYIWDVFSGEFVLPVKGGPVFLNQEENEVYAIVETYPDNIKLINQKTGEIVFKIDYMTFYDYIYYSEERFIAHGTFQIIDFPSEEIILDEFMFFGFRSYFVKPDEELFLYADWKEHKTKLVLHYLEFGSWKPLPELEQTITLPESAEEYPPYPDCLDLSLSWKYFTFFYDHHIYIWDLGKEQIISISEEIEYVWDKIIFSPDGNLFYTNQADGGDSKVQIWGTQTGRKLYELPVPLNWWIQSIAVSPDGKLIAVLVDDGTIRIYGVRSENP